MKSHLVIAVMASFLLSATSVVISSAAQAKDANPVSAEKSSSPPAYDVISIKPHKPGDNSSMVRWTNTTYTATNASLRNLIASAYDVKGWLVFGLPPWAEKATWDLQAKISESDGAGSKSLTPADQPAMMLKLLRDRFGLAAHSESKVQPIYQMTVLPAGSKLTESAPLPPPSDGEKPRANGGTWSVGNGVLKAKHMSMDTLARNLAYQVERVINDQTGLTGVYDLELHWTPEDRTTAENGSTGDTPPAIFTAMREQLGLRLIPTKAPVPTVVVDQIRKPEED